MKLLAENAGEDGNVVVANVKKEKKGVGFNVMNGQYVSMIKAGIIDPVKVTRNAVQNAVSVATMILTTARMSSLRRTRTVSSVSNPRRAFIFTRPTDDRS